MKTSGRWLAVVVALCLWSAGRAWAGTEYQAGSEAELGTAITSLTADDSIRLTGSIQISGSLPSSTVTGISINGDGFTLNLNGKAGFSFIGIHTIDAITITGGRRGAGGAVSVGGAFAGGITGSTFSDNTATGGGYGGAVFVNGAFAGGITGSTFSDNTATGGNGGAVYMYETFAGGITDSTFSDNTAGGNGGAVFVNHTFAGGITGSTFSDNTANGSGGAVYVNQTFTGGITGSTFSDNTANGFGGAVYVNQTFTGGITGSTFSDNTATGGGSGGAVSVYETFAGGITGSTFSGNTADVSGGAVFVNQTFTGGITGSTFSDNTANGFGGAVYVNQTFTGGITGSTFSDNTARGPGGAVYVFGGFAGGITGSTFSGNTASGGGGGAVSVLETFAGGITGSTFSDNTVDGPGGAVYVYQTFAGGITGSTFSDNTANGSGGAVNVNQTFEGGITGSTFSDNTAGGNGGAVYVQQTFAGGITGSTFSGNTADRSGGAVSVLGTFSGGITGSTFSGNKAELDGGAFFIRSASAFEIRDSTFTNNQAAGVGGALFLDTSVAPTDPNIPGHDILLTASQGKTTRFSGNSAGGASSSLHFGRFSAGESLHSASLDLRPDAGGFLDLRDAITVDMTNSTLGVSGIDQTNTFALAVGGDGVLHWGGRNDLDAQGGSTVLFRGGSDITLLPDFQLGNIGAASVGGSHNGALAVTFQAGSVLALDLAGRDPNLAVFAKGPGDVTITGNAALKPILYDFAPVDTDYLIVQNGVVADPDAFSLQGLPFGFDMSLAEHGGSLFLHADNNRLREQLQTHDNPNVRAMWDSGALVAAWASVPDDQREGVFHAINARPDQFHNDLSLRAVSQVFASAGAMVRSARDQDIDSYQTTQTTVSARNGAASASANASLPVGTFRRSFLRGLRFWGGYSGGKGDHESTGGLSGLDTRQNTVVVGAGYDVSRQFGFSVYYGHGRAHASSRTDDSRVRSTLNMVGGRLTVRPTDALRFDLDGFFLHSDNDARRRNLLGIYQAEYDTRSWGMALRGGYDIRRGALTVTPWADLSWQRLSQDSSAERGPAWFRTRLSGLTGGSVATRLGVDASWRFSFLNGRSLTPRVHAVWSHDFGKRQWRSTAGFVGTTPTYTVRSGTQDRNALQLGAAMEAVVLQSRAVQVSLYAGYDLVVSRRFTGQYWNAGVTVRF